MFIWGCILSHRKPYLKIPDIMKLSFFNTGNKIACFIQT